MAYIIRDGVAVYYEVHGDGPVILLSHGYGATGRMWSDQLDLITRTHRAVVWDMRGHGRTDSPADPTLYSEEHTISDMDAILDAVGASKAIIGGHSLGGYMSMAFHNSRPERVAGLVLCGTGPGYRKDDSRDAWNGFANGIADAIAQNGLDELTRRSTEMRPNDHKSVDGLVNAARGMLTQRDSRILESLPSIRVPTLIAVGSTDVRFLNGVEYLASKISGSKRIVFEGAGHAVNIDAAAAFNAELANFLQN